MKRRRSFLSLFPMPPAPRFRHLLAFMRNPRVGWDYVLPVLSKPGEPSLQDPDVYRALTRHRELERGSVLVPSHWSSLPRSEKGWEGWWKCLAALPESHPVDADAAHCLSLRSLTALLDAGFSGAPSPTAPWRHRSECALCLTAAESTDHLFTSCSTLPLIWRSVAADLPLAPSLAQLVCPSPIPDSDVLLPRLSFIYRVWTLRNVRRFAARMPRLLSSTQIKGVFLVGGGLGRVPHCPACSL
jgi:hypothetical protein